uniref:Reverse transcriptase domain-containing protein n=1 Tax=Tanacetum cinerariifolium TaxID=118510 RepID=A0A6L2LVK8_TANCI|nr:hypothetical protein [Tanacetum cinerariifolium]
MYHPSKSRMWDVEDAPKVKDCVGEGGLRSWEWCGGGGVEGSGGKVSGGKTSCDNCIYGDGKPITCNECVGMLRGGFCLPCNLKAENSFICYPNAYSFNDTSNNSNYLPQPQYENYLCNLLGNNSHDGYDCQQQFPFVYKKEPSYNKNYDDNYYPHVSPSFPCCDNCGESHEIFQCQPMDQNIDFSGSDQIQTQQYLEVHPSSQEISDEVFHAKGDLMKSIQTFLEEFNCIPFEEKETILLQAWFNFFAIMHDQPENLNELFQKLLEYLKELAEYKESLENSSKEIAEQKQNMEDTILELVEIFRQKELLCVHDNADDLIESSLNSKLLSINSQRLDNKEQEVKNVVEQPTERGNHSIESLQNFRVIHKSSISLNNTSPIYAVAPILSTKELKYSPSMGDDDDFEDIEYVEASLSDPEIVSVEEENFVYQEEEEIDLKDISQIQDVVLREKLLSINRLIANIESLNDNPTPDLVLNSSVSFPISEEFDNSLSDNFLSEFETFYDHTKETRSGNTTHADNSLPEDPLLEEADLFLSDNSIPPGTENFADDSEGDIRLLKALLIDDSIPFPNNELSDDEASDFDNPLVPLPPPEPLDFDFALDAGDEISVVMNVSDELECIDAKVEFDNDDYSSFMFVKVFSFLLSAESKDTIFDPGFTPHRLKFLVFGYLSRSKRSSHPLIKISLGKSISFDQYCLALFAAFMLRLVSIGDNVSFLVWGKISSDMI